MRIDREDPFVKILMLKGEKGDKGDTGGEAELTNYYNKTETDSLLSNKVDKSAIVQAAGNSATNIMSQEAVTDLLDTKFDKSAIVQALGNSTTSAMSQNAITENLNGKADKSDLNNYYTKSETYTQTEIDDKITRIPQFNIQVVDELPTTNISTTTVYIVPSTVGADTIYKEYIYSDNEWKLLGDQTVDLSDYYTKETTDSLLSNKVDKSSIVQATGNSTTSVMSQDAVTDSLDAKFDKSSIVQITGNSTTSVMSQDAVTDALKLKMDQSWVQQTTGIDQGWVMSQKAVTDALNGKIDKSAIEQGPGYSNLGVMSQKAVTDALDGKLDKSWYSSGTFSPVFGWVNPNSDRTNYGDAGVFTVTYSKQRGIYIKIGDLCYVTFSIKGKMVYNPHSKMVVGSLPYDADSSWPFQTLSLGVCVKLSANDEQTQIWTPTAGIAARMVSGKNFAIITQNNGYEEIDWLLDTTNIFYLEGSGIYKIKTN